MLRVLLDDARAPNLLTPDYLSHSISPYLSALAMLQLVADLIRGRENPLTIEQITSENGRIVACVHGALDAIHFAEREIPGWQQTHLEAIRSMRELDDMLTWLTDGETQAQVLMQRDDLRVRMQPDLLRLVLDYLSHVSPDAPELGQVVYVDRLLNAFHLLAFSAITVVVL